MPLADLSPSGREIVRDCVRAAAEGPFFPDWEFSTLFGLTRDELKTVLSSWPNLDKAVVLAINNSFNNLLGYSHRRHDVWSEFVPVSSQELQKNFMKWKGTDIENYFGGLM